jgi:hypothetical protein
MNRPSTFTLAIFALLAAAATSACSDPASESFEPTYLQDDGIPQYTIQNVNVAINDARCAALAAKPEITLLVDFQDLQFKSMLTYQSEPQHTCQPSFQLPRPTDFTGSQVLLVKVSDNAETLARCPFHARDLESAGGPSSGVYVVACEHDGTQIKVIYSDR